MRFILNPYIATPIVAIVQIAAVLFWYVLVRPVPEKAAIEVIISKQFQPADHVERTVPRTMRSFEYYPKLNIRWLERGAKMGTAFP